MILSGRDIQHYMDLGLLKIGPVEADQFQQNGIDLVVHPQILDLFTGKQNNVFYHGRANLVVTNETIEMPNDLMAFVLIRSTWARRGLFPPGTVVDAGFKGNLTIELFNGGPDLTLYKSERIIHLIFAKLTNPTIPYAGKYQGQTGITMAKS